MFFLKKIFIFIGVFLFSTASFANDKIELDFMVFETTDMNKIATGASNALSSYRKPGE